MKQLVIAVFLAATVPFTASAATVKLDTIFDATSIGGSSSENISIEFNYNPNTPLFDPAPIGGIIYRYDAGIDATVTVGAETVSVTGGGVTVIGDGVNTGSSYFQFNDSVSNHITGTSTGTILGRTLSAFSVSVGIDASAPLGAIPTGSTPLVTDQFSDFFLSFGNAFQIYTPTYENGQLEFVAPVPLPAGLPMLIGGIAILGLASSRRRKLAT